MESTAIRSERRGRKMGRKKGSGSVSVDDPIAPQAKRRAIETRSKVLVGRYVKKDFVGSGVFLGKIVYYDSGFYRIDYEDGDCEDLDSSEIRGILVGEGDLSDALVVRKKNLDDFILNKDANKTANPEAKTVELTDAVEKVEVSSLSEVSCGLSDETGGAQVDGSADSSIDLCKDARDGDSVLDAGSHVGPPPELPPSSGNIGIPEEYVSHLFSVYSFLRSFGIRLFLYPFGLDDFVGSLNCVVPNTVLDSIHVALLRALRRHLEMLSSDGSELASKCLRCIDWSLLDVLTWPVYIVHYLTTMGYTGTPDWKGFYADVLNKEYYNLTAGRKLLVLQILCDDVLESAELRAEIDMREASEVGIDSDEIMTNQLDSGPRRVHPRYPKTSACKDQEAISIIAESQKTNWLCSSNSLGSKCTELDKNSADDELDGNGDECCLCGMDGTLLCCDGCPSAYHSRCIGVNKLSIPEGSWFCPECTCNMTGPTITRGTLLGAADIFGIDPHGQVFLGTCNHLLVLNPLEKEDSCHKYYNQNDIPKVLQALYSSVQNRAVYLGICKAVLQYWEIPEDILSLTEMVESHVTLANQEEDTKFSTLLLPPCKETHAGLNMDDRRNSIIENKIENLADSFHGTSLCTLADLQSSDARSEQSNLKPQQLTKELTIPTGSADHQADPSGLTHQSLADRLCVKDLVTSGNTNARIRGAHVNGIFSPQNTTSQSRGASFGPGEKIARSLMDDRSYLGSFFKPQAYLNQYIHGDFAASAAANLAVLSSEENRGSEDHAMENSRRVLSADILLQVKAFSSVAVRFFWPNYEKKAVEVPRERCGWCLSCKAPVTSKRACLLNSAALSVIKGAMKTLSGLHLIKNGEGSLHGIATYILYMEGSLCGLTAGPFANASFRKRWRRRVEQASTCSALKALLLELEENIHAIALSGEWLKLVDNLSAESSATHGTSCTAGPAQRRGPGRRSKKLSVIPEVNDDGCNDKQGDFSWWRGGKVSKFIHQKGILPHKMIKKAARQGGSRKIGGSYYSEGFEIPKRSRQTVWRAAVEMSQNASQLALQVRYLDLNIRWSDLSRPEQNVQDGKGPETEASAFRNAFICDKKIMENKSRYGVAFGNQKHLPSRVLKSIIEVEKSDGKEKYWFLETRIPLYLIKEYEEREDKVSLPFDGKSSNELSVTQRRQLKASRRDVFSYLMRKRDNLDECSCSSCQLGVLIGNAVKCSVCEGFCHLKCTVRSAVNASEAVDSMITCKQCYFASGFTQPVDASESPTSPLPSQGKEYQNIVNVSKGVQQKASIQSVTYPRTTCPEIKSAPDSSLATKNHRGLCSLGLIWKKTRKKKEDNDDNGFNFRLNNIILRGNPNMNGSKPICHLCRQPYNAELMYILCQHCPNWYHADAVELEESKIFDLWGFKCCKCRRIKSPVCPYADPALRKPEVKKTRPRPSKGSSVDLDSGFVTHKEWHPAAQMLPKKDEFIQDDDSLQSSLSRVEQIVDPNSETNFKCTAPGPQKLPVRRQVKCEDRDDYFENSPLCVQESTIQTPNVVNTLEETSSPTLGMDTSVIGLGDEMMFDYSIDYDDMEFEPQTYFSFTELLESEEGGQLDEVDPSALFSENLQNESSKISQYELAASNVELAAGSITHCGICSQTEPAPDLSCKICQLCMHSSCSPWDEPLSFEDGWSCGHCREWR